MPAFCATKVIAIFKCSVKIIKTMHPLMNLSDSHNWPNGKETFNSTIFIETNGLVLGGVVLTIALIIAILIVQRKK